MAKTKIRKILIANRGEIALRIIRACRELGIKSVAIFSEPDRLAPFVQMADEAFALGGITSQESYLDINKVIDVLNSSGADAVHPAYGFLSENQDFAQKVKQAGKIFIGPDNHAIEIMGNKTNARKQMLAANVPCVPGTESGIRDLNEAKQIAMDIGFPVLIKAAMGGGGKGMRLVHKESELEASIIASQNEARSAFGDDTVYIEKFVENPRHIEIQVIGDQHGNYVHLFERECSIQRRHQKVIEEAPSSILSTELRMKMGQSAIDCAKSVDYFSAGTVEFLVDEKLNYYFLEMNTRLQVEHPITEMITGVDIVKEMIHIAEGKELSVKQKDIRINGHAIEARLYAEDVYEKFMPTSGKITFMKASDGPGIREDCGYEQGNEVSPYYDPMISKLIAWAPSREESIQRLKRALKEYQISGIKTTIPFCLMVLDHEAFTSGKYNTKFVELYLDELLQTQFNTEEYAAIASVLIENLKRNKLESVVHRNQNHLWARA